MQENKLKVTKVICLVKMEENLLSVSSPLNSFPTIGDFCHLLITSANSLDPDQTRQNVRPDLDPNCLTL